MGRDKRAARAEDRTITLIPIEPLDERHGALVVEAFGRLFIGGGGQPDGWGDGYGYGDGNGGDGNGGGYDDGLVNALLDLLDRHDGDGGRRAP